MMRTYIIESLIAQTNEAYKAYKEADATFTFKSIENEEKKAAKDKIKTYFDEVNVCAKLVQEGLAPKLNIVFDIDNTLVFA